MSYPGDARLEYKVPLMVPTYGNEEIREVLSALKSRKVTMGEKVARFEKDWARYIGTRYALMVNSGSSANLLAHALFAPGVLDRRIHRGDEVITPAVTWATTASPIVNVGATPVFVDVDLDTFDIKVDDLDQAISNKTVGITFVHLLGNPCDVDGIRSFERSHGLILIEDACNAHGAEYKGRKCGSFGDVGTFSFYFTHIISTIEGGMITTDDQDLYELAKAMRSFGWTRGLKSERGISERLPFADKRFLFAYLGFNFRPTELQGAFGIHQIRRLEGFLRVRRENARYWLDELKKFEKYFILPKTTKGGRHVWHHFPLTVRPGGPFSRDEIIEFLEHKGIETRPIGTGNITEQPVFSLMKAKKVGHLKNARLIMRNSFQWGNHHMVGESQRTHIVDCIEEFIRSR